MYVASVLDKCCKSRLGCCIYCNGCTRMLQRSVTSVSSVFWDVCCKCVYLDVAFVSHVSCMCFIWMLRMFAKVFKYFQVFFKCFRSMLQVCILNISVVFRHMLQVFYLNVAYVVVATHICCKHMFKCFNYFRRMLQQVLHTASVS